MAGRKRKFGVARNPNGQIATKVYRQTKPKANDLALEQRRQHFGAVRAEDPRNGKGRSHANDRRYGYALGRLSIAGLISTVEHNVGLDFAKLFEDYRAVADVPCPVIRAIDHMPRSRGSSCGAPIGEEEAAAIKRRYERAIKKMNKAGGGVYSALYDVVVRDLDIDYQDERQREKVSAALTALADMFSPQPKRQPRRRTASPTRKLVVGD